MDSFCFSGSEREIQLRSRYYLQFNKNSVAVFSTPKALSLRLFDADQKLIVLRA